MFGILCVQLRQSMISGTGSWFFWIIADVYAWGLLELLFAAVPMCVIVLAAKLRPVFARLVQAERVSIRCG